jgi:hypothetical protein
VPIIRMLMLAFAKTLSKLFGVATMTFFGRAPSRDDDKVALVGILSVSWLFTIPAVLFPAYGEAVMPFLPDDEGLIRAVAAFVTVVVPPLNGYIVTRVQNHEDGSAAVARHLLYGYGYTLVLGLLVIALVVVVPVVKSSYIFRRFDLKHIAIMISEEHYDEILDEIRDALGGHGIDTEVEEPHWTIRRLFAGLVWIEGKIFRREYMSKDMKIIRGELEDGGWFEVTLHATDISILGQKHETTVVAAILSEELDSGHIYFSWDDASQEVEDRIRDARARLERGERVDPAEISELCDDLRDLELSTEEWNAIRRLLYRLELDCQRAGSRSEARAS